MIRPFTTLCLLAACGSGLYLYSEKHRTAMLDRDIGRVIRETEATRARTGLLRAEWALLNEPGRLQDMAERYLTLKTMAPTQFVQLASLSTHLPPVEMKSAGAGGGTDEDEDQPQPARAAVPAADSGGAPAVAPATPAEPVLAARTEARPADRLTLHDDAKPRVPRRVAPAEHQDALRGQMLARSTPLPLAAPQPTGASVFSALARPMPAPAHRTTIVAAVPRYAGASPLVSALGGGGSLPPPVPYGR
jgi:hypothetical protein